MTHHKNGLLSGPKFNGRHSTVVRGAEAVLLEAKNQDEVSRIVIAVIDTVGGSSRPRLKFQEIQAGFRLKVIAPDGAQEFFVYTSNKEKTRKLLQERWDKEHK